MSGRKGMKEYPAEGKAHGTTIGMVCHKLLIRSYVILKENRPYVVREITPATIES
jgi:hypothetical protein